MASTCAPSTFWRKLARRHHWLLPIKGRQKATYTERPISNPSKEGTRTAQSEGSSTLRLRYLSFPCKLVGAFARTQQKRPYATQVGSSIIIWGCGDLLAQNFGGADYDPWRTLRHLTIGITVSIPGYIWCGVLNRARIDNSANGKRRFIYLGQSFNYASKIKSLAAKVVVNQAVFAPAFSTYFFGMQSLLSGSTLQGTAEHIKHTVPVSLMNSCKLWPAVTAFNFTYVQPQYRALFAGTSFRISLWGSLISG